MLPAPCVTASSSALLNAGMSPGLRLVIRLPSATTLSSTQVPPALRMSVCRLGQEVSVRPSRTPASIRVHGAWQMAATGLPEATKSRMKFQLVVFKRFWKLAKTMVLIHWLWMGL